MGDKNKGNLNVDDLWIICSMDKKMEVYCKCDDYVYWFAKILWKYGHGTEVAKQVAIKASQANDRYDYSKALHTVFKRLMKFEQNI